MLLPSKTSASTVCRFGDGLLLVVLPIVKSLKHFSIKCQDLMLKVPDA